jgi:hypothetical protein
MFGCGASDFEKLSVIARTALLEGSPVSEGNGVPIGQLVEELESTTRERIIPLTFVG